MNHKLIGQLVAVFIVIQFIGLGVAFNLILSDTQVQLLTENPNDLINVVYLIAVILFFTGVLLVSARYFKGHHFYKLLEALIIFSTSVIVFEIFFNSLSAIVLALVLIALKNMYPKRLLVRNSIAVIASAAAGAIIGLALGLIPIILFIIFLACYDLIAVFKTKHMVTLAKSLTKRNLVFTIALPTKKHQFELGTGDLVIPLAVGTALLKENFYLFAFPINFVPTLLVLLASLMGLIFTVNYAGKKVGRALPALPPQVLGMILTIGLMKLIGF
ncbi:MAG: presenilin family intramembrane aspartyl protease [archaeon]